MPFYNDLRPISDFEDTDYLQIFPTISDEEKIRTIDGLIRLKEGLAREVNVRESDTNILIASWNIKEFGHTKQRLPESYFYIAEVLSKFDLIAVQEIKSSIKDLSIVMRLLGSDWDYLINDITNGSDGNSERSAYIFNTKRISLGGLAGELTAWDDIVDEGSTISQLVRAPFITSFKAGWKRFALINLHLHPNGNTEGFNIRREEVNLLLKILSEKRRKKQLWTDNLILVGDFNFYPATASNRKDADTVELIHNSGYREVDALIGIDTNVSNTAAYDRFFIRTSEYFKIACDQETQCDHGGVFDPFDYVFREEDRPSYHIKMQNDYGGAKDMTIEANLASYFSNPWRKNQLSDHLPIWFELTIDSSVEFLMSKRGVLTAD